MLYLFTTIYYIMSAIQSKQCTILIVERDLSLSFLLEKAMQKAQYQTICEANKTNFFAILEQNSVDLILLDVMINQWNNFHICQEIRQHVALPIVVLSALSSPSAKDQAKRLGANAYLAKPVRLTELLLCVESLLSVA